MLKSTEENARIIADEDEENPVRLRSKLRLKLALGLAAIPSWTVLAEQPTRNVSARARAIGTDKRQDEPARLIVEEHGLVVKALCDGLGNCVKWDYKSALIVRDNNEIEGLTPALIRKSVIAFVRDMGGAVVEQIGALQ